MSLTCDSSTPMESTTKMALQETTKTFAQLFKRAYMEASDEVQEVIASMCDVIGDPSTSEDDEVAAIETLFEALFPKNGVDKLLGIDIEHIHSVEHDDYEKAQALSIQQEATFADNLRRVLDEKEMTQEFLAEKIGVGQSAISMMLARSCRPQKKTVIKIAQALGVEPDELWPGNSILSSPPSLQSPPAAP